ncbi:14_t:CDS:2 [Funneliformis caledonium]|uniref:14_t:CDS:1 n=1 Tax=Funneliformis caledonium TaxID=1117310 RepID=A0A9N9CKZ6_9GLOM|nr:14_t:CDS:2 [Funneliformis caledonium]
MESLDNIIEDIDDRSNLSEGSITTLKISTGETVDKLRIMIRDRKDKSIESQIEEFSDKKRLNETGMP